MQPLKIVMLAITCAFLAVSCLAEEPAAEPDALSLKALEPLIGTWVSYLDPKYKDHPGIKMRNPDLKSHELSFQWGVGKEVIHLRATNLDRPDDGDRTIFLEGVIMQNPDTGKIQFLSYNSPDDQLFEGEIASITANGIERRYMTYFKGGHDVMEFRELWEWDNTDKTSFNWLTDHVVDGEFKRNEIIVRYDRK